MLDANSQTAHSENSSQTLSPFSKMVLEPNLERFLAYPLSSHPQMSGLTNYTLQMSNIGH